MIKIFSKIMFVAITLTLCLMPNVILGSLLNATVQPSNTLIFQTGSNPPNFSTSKEFIYPIGKDGYATQKRDGDGWYNARDFREVNHLGEDWNKESGGNTDCGLPIRAISNGKIIFAKTNIEGWGNVLIIRHLLENGNEIESLYGHLRSFTKTSGDVKKGEIIGLIGDGGGIYNCHLHLEIRFSDCPDWGQPGAGYSPNSKGWTDPSTFIDSYNSPKPKAKPKSIYKLETKKR
jgi:murein DD-endopeptidase MepM/ murein hydrolase activator NlpD